MSKKILCAFICALSLPLCSFAASVERMKGDLDSIANVMRNHYAMFDWKEKLFGWSLENEVETAKSRIDAMDSITHKDFQGILSDFFASFRDFHVGVKFISTESARLPFHV